MLCADLVKQIRRSHKPIRYTIIGKYVVHLNNEIMITCLQKQFKDNEETGYTLNRDGLLISDKSMLKAAE